MKIIKKEICIIGTGIAGCMAALNLAQNYAITLICQDSLSDNATSWAQGGIAISTNDQEINKHIQDTLNVGQKLNTSSNVENMVKKSAKILSFLNHLGVDFDKDANGFKKALEAGHSEPRVFHHKDKTGKEIK